MEQNKVLSFSDLRVHFRTGRSYVISGTGRNRKYGCRRGVMCNAGDIESSEWCRQVKDLIRRSGEQALFDHLYEFMRHHNYCHSSKTELEEEALQLYVSRIFNNEAWVHFVEFNRLYRPEALQRAQLRQVKMDCCNETGWVTQKRVEMAGGMDGSIPCPICGKWSPFVFTDVGKKGRKSA